MRIGPDVSEVIDDLMVVARHTSCAKLRDKIEETLVRREAEKVDL